MRVGLVGLGSMGKGHASVLNHLDLVDDVIGCDLNESLRHESEKQLQMKTVPSLDRLLEENIAAIFVVTHATAHAAVIRPCLARGLPVFTEKPLATTLDDACELVALAEAKGVYFQVGFELRYSGMTRGMQEIVASGLLGEPVHMNLIQISGQQATPGKMVPAHCGGIFYEKLCHQVDLYRLWFGEPEKIMAVAAPAVFNHYGVHDNVHATMVFPGGKIGGITFITSRAAQIGGTDDHLDRGHFYELILTCTDGSITYNAWNETLEVVRFNHRDDRQSELIDSIDIRPRWGEPAYDLKTQNRDFLERVKCGKPLQYPASDALKTMTWVELGERSLQANGEWAYWG